MGLLLLLLLLVCGAGKPLDASLLGKEHWIDQPISHELFSLAVATTWKQRVFGS